MEHSTQSQSGMAAQGGQERYGTVAQVGKERHWKQMFALFGYLPPAQNANGDSGGHQNLIVDGAPNTTHHGRAETESQSGQVAHRVQEKPWLHMFSLPKMRMPSRFSARTHNGAVNSELPPGLEDHSGEAAQDAKGKSWLQMGSVSSYLPKAPSGRFFGKKPNGNVNSDEHPASETHSGEGSRFFGRKSNGNANAAVRPASEDQRGEGAQGGKPKHYLNMFALAGYLPPAQVKEKD